MKRQVLEWADVVFILFVDQVVVDGDHVAFLVEELMVIGNAPESEVQPGRFNIAIVTGFMRAITQMY